MKKRIGAVLLAAVTALQCAGTAAALNGQGIAAAAEITVSDISGKSGETGDSGETEKPGETENPKETEKPNETEKPEETEAPEHVHVWEQGEVLTEPTCTKDGVRLLVCTVCKETKRETVPAEHTPGGWKTEREATCAQRGKRVQLCKVCGGTVRTDTIPLKEHVWGEWQRLCDATLYNPGQEWCRCVSCGKTRIRSVSDKLAAGLILTPLEATMKVGESGRPIRAAGMAAGDAIVSWKSGNPKVASVTSDGRITAKKEGRTTITVTLTSETSVKATVYVKGYVKTRKITKVPAKLTLKKGKKRTLHPKLKPSNAAEKITYSSSDKKVAKVSAKGTITAKKKGTAVITVKSGSKTAKCRVTVK